MECKFVEPKVDRDVVITMKESEAKSIRCFIGETSGQQRIDMVNDVTYNDGHVADFYTTLYESL